MLNLDHWVESYNENERSNIFFNLRTNISIWGFSNLNSKNSKTFFKYAIFYCKNLTKLYRFLNRKDPYNLYFLFNRSNFLYVYLSYSSSVHLEFSAAQVVLWRHNWHLKMKLSKYLSLYSLFLFNRSNFLYFYSSYRAIVHLEFSLSQVVLWRHNRHLKMNLSKYLSLYSLFFVQSI